MKKKRRRKWFHEAKIYYNLLSFSKALKEIGTRTHMLGIVDS